MKIYIAANKYEGCGHAHRSADAARVCLRRYNKSPDEGGPFRIYWRDTRAKGFRYHLLSNTPTN